MNSLIIRKITWLLTSAFGLTIILNIYACKPSQKVAAKTGVQLWSENCQRCHNTPSPTTFSHEQWETIGLHMQSRALLTNDEKDKIIAFMKQ